MDTVTGLGVRNPVCDKLDEIRDRATRIACEEVGTPESNYPAANYGFDIWVDTGLFHAQGYFVKFFMVVLNGIWLSLIFVLKLILALLGFAFGLNPFGEGQTMSRISSAVIRLYTRITDPWLSTLVVAGGIWFAYKALIKREVSASVGGTLAAIALLVLGMWIVHKPRASVGQLADMSNEIALLTISAPQAGSVDRPTGTYAEAMARTWSRLVEIPFAGLNFSDVRWALGRPPAEAVEKADEKFCADHGALNALAILGDFGSDKAKEACKSYVELRFNRPRRVIDLYLRSSPGSPSRKALWEYFKDEDEYEPKVAAQGGDGVLTRLSMLALFAVGMIGGILLLAWLAVRLFMQAAIAFVLLLVAPIALFFPMLGETGRRAFKTWGLTLFGATVAKVVYALFLSVVLAGISIFDRIGNSTGTATGFLLSCAFTWAVFLKRDELVGWMSLQNSDQSKSAFGLSKLAGFMVARRMAQMPGQLLKGAAAGVKGVGKGAGAGVSGVGSMASRGVARGVEATREMARTSLDNSAQRLANARYDDARRTVREFEGASRPGTRPSDPSAPPPEGRPGSGPKASQPVDPQSAQTSTSSTPSPSRPDAERYRRAKALLSHVEDNERRLGRRWSEADLSGFAEQDRNLLRNPKDLKANAYRAGYGASQFSELRGRDRDDAERAIRRAIKRDKQRSGVVSKPPPGRVVGRARNARERFNQWGEGASLDRRDHLRRLRRDYRTSARDAKAAAREERHRRNLSRGL